MASGVVSPTFEERRSCEKKATLSACFGAMGDVTLTDSAIIKFLEENHVYHGIRKSKLDCVALEELLRSEYGDIIWASVKIQGTRLLIDLQENLASNTARETVTGKEPSDLAAAKDAEIYSIYTRQGMPLVKKGAVVKQGDLLVEGRIPIYNDSGELVNYRNCYADADILGITSYAYQDIFPLGVDFRKIRTTACQQSQAYDDCINSFHRIKN